MWMILQSNLTNARARIFIGTVEAHVPASRSEGSMGGLFQARLMRIRPYLVLRGPLPTDKTEVWSEGIGDCGPDLEVGGTYFLVARFSEDGRLATGACSYTAPLYLHGLILSVLAGLLLIAIGTVWAFWRLGRWLLLHRRSTTRVTQPRGARRLRNSPLAWLVISSGFAALALLLVRLGPQLAGPVEVTVCNDVPDESLEQVEAALLPEAQGAPASQLGRLASGECRTVQLLAHEVEAVGIRYRLQGAQFTVEDEALRYVEAGFHASTSVQGPGRSQSEVYPFEEPDRRVLVLAWGLLAALVGATAALVCAASTGGWWFIRRLARTRAG
jgi:hypothetical protein